MSDYLFLCLEWEIEKGHFALWSSVHHRDNVGVRGVVWDLSCTHCGG